MEIYNQDELEAKKDEILSWMGLENIPKAADLDPENIYGLQTAFTKSGGYYQDPLPAEMVKDLIAEGNGKHFKLLSPQEIKKRTFELFREQAESAAQYLAKLGFNPEAEGKRNVLKTYNTNHKNIKVSVLRGGREADAFPVSAISLVFESLTH